MQPFLFTFHLIRSHFECYHREHSHYFFASLETKPVACRTNRSNNSSNTPRLHLHWDASQKIFNSARRFKAIVHRESKKKNWNWVPKEETTELRFGIHSIRNWLLVSSIRNGKCHFADGRSSKQMSAIRRQLKCVKLSIDALCGCAPRTSNSSSHRIEIMTLMIISKTVCVRCARAQIIEWKCKGNAASCGVRAQNSHSSIDGRARLARTTKYEFRQLIIMIILSLNRPVGRQVGTCHFKVQKMKTKNEEFESVPSPQHHTTTAQQQNTADGKRSLKRNLPTYYHCNTKMSFPRAQHAPVHTFPYRIILCTHNHRLIESSDFTVVTRVLRNFHSSQSVAAHRVLSSMGFLRRKTPSESVLVCRPEKTMQNR